MYNNIPVKETCYFALDILIQRFRLYLIDVSCISKIWINRRISLKIKDLKKHILFFTVLSQREQSVWRLPPSKPAAGTFTNRTWEMRRGLHNPDNARPEISAIRYHTVHVRSVYDSSKHQPSVLTTAPFCCPHGTENSLCCTLISSGYVKAVFFNSM